MSRITKISWTDATWNPLYGCSRVSEGCRNCYAEEVVAGLPRKFKGRNPEAFAFYSGLTKDTPSGPRWTGVVKVHEGHLLQPLSWQKPKRIFVNSLSDLFHDAVSERDILRIFSVMSGARHHTFQLLTKRPQRMHDLLNKWAADDWNPLEEASSELAGENGWCHLDPLDDEYPLKNLWLGVSVEDQDAADERIPLLLKTPAAVRFLSCEPLLGPVDLISAAFDGAGKQDPLQGISWVIVGGESGPNYRPMNQEWAQSLRDQCVAAKVAFFFKQDADRKPGQRPYLHKHNDLYQSWHQFPGQLTEPEVQDV